MGQGKSSKGKRLEISTAIVVALIGLLGTAITAYFGYLALTRPTELSISATQAANNFAVQFVSQDSFVTFLPIPEKDLLIKTFNLPGSGTQVDLRLIAINFDLDFDFSAPLEMECDTFVYNITQHFAFDKYMEIDLSKLSGGYNNEGWHKQWLPIINGTSVDYYSCATQTLQNLGVMNGDLIGLKIEWYMPVTLSLPPTAEITPTPEPTYPSPPHIIP